MCQFFHSLYTKKGREITEVKEKKATVEFISDENPDKCVSAHVFQHVYIRSFHPYVVMNHACFAPLIL